MKELKLTHSDFADLYNRLALLMRSGITVGVSLLILSEEEENPAYASMLKSMGEQMEEGSPLDTVLEDAKCFPVSDIGMLSIAEHTGNTEQTLTALAQYHENRERILRSLKNAFTYPAILLLVMLIVIFVLLTKVLPIFDEVYQSMGGGVTGLAAHLLSFGNAVNRALPALAITAAVLLIAALVIAMIPKATNGLKKLFSKIMGDRGVYRKLNNAQIAQVLSVALASGIPIEEGMDFAQKIMLHVPSAMRRLETCRRLLDENTSLTEALRQTDLFSKSACNMLTIGERTGEMDSVMAHIADQMSQEAEEALENQIMKIEPALVIITSVLVGIILLTVMLPLINIMKAI